MWLLFASFAFLGIGFLYFFYILTIKLLPI